jgi:hypothetical protein
VRIGQNPNKSAIAATSFAPVVLAVITHLPNRTTAYHSKRMEVVQTCLDTMRIHARADHTFLVWDNGSMPEFRNWLQYDFKPDMLMLSENIGKNAARTAIGRMIPPASILAYSDDDMLFFDNWLAPQIELLEHFPNVAAVSGYPVRTQFRWGNENTLKWAREHATLEQGIFIPRAWEDDFALSVGRDPKWHADYSRNDVDYRVLYQGRQAYCTAHHCQFIARGEQVARVLQYDNKAQGEEKSFDVAMDNLGLRLSTINRQCRHIGNVMDEEIKQDIMMIGANYA